MGLSGEAYWGSVSDVCLDRGRRGYGVDVSRLVQKVFPKRQARQFLLMIFVTSKSYLCDTTAQLSTHTHTHAQVPPVLLFDFFNL